jgi:hypothetical protein
MQENTVGLFSPPCTYKSPEPTGLFNQSSRTGTQLLITSRAPLVPFSRLLRHAGYNGPILTPDPRGCDAIRRWSDDWLVTFSAPKTKGMVISNKFNRNIHPQITLNNIVVEDVTTHKQLGLVLSNNIGWASHIDEVYVKAMNRLDIIQDLFLHMSYQS